MDVHSQVCERGTIILEVFPTFVDEVTLPWKIVGTPKQHFVLSYPDDQIGDSSMISQNHSTSPLSYDSR